MLEANIEALRKDYDREHVHNLVVEKAIPEMHARFWKIRGILSWLSNHHEALVTVYDLVITEECKYTEEEGRIFDESTYLLHEFSEEEIGIISTHFDVKATAEEELMKEVGEASKTTDESEQIQVPSQGSTDSYTTPAILPINATTSAIEKAPTPSLCCQSLLQNLLSMGIKKLCNRPHQKPRLAQARPQQRLDLLPFPLLH